MAHDFLKIGLTLVVLGLVVAAMALLVSGYLSAYKPGGKGVQTPAAAVSGSKSLSRAAPSPIVSASARPIPAGYMPPGPAMRGPAQPALMPMPMLEMQPPMGPSPSVTPSRPAFEMPAVPSAPGISSIIQVLFRLLPLIFSHHFDLTPIWPSLNR